VQSVEKVELCGPARRQSRAIDVGAILVRLRRVVLGRGLDLDLGLGLGRCVGGGRRSIEAEQAGEGARRRAT
jgi:hypothetical protein